LRTGIPVQAWLEGDWRDVLTAIELLTDEDRRHRGGGPVMSG
jgi:hypothetical protein